MSIRSNCSRHLVTVGRKTGTAGTSGSLSYTYPDQGKKSCWVQVKGSGEEVEAAQPGNVKLCRLYFTKDPAIKNGDHLRWEDTSEIITTMGDSMDVASMGRMWQVDGVIDEKHQSEDVT